MPLKTSFINCNRSKVFPVGMNENVLNNDTFCCKCSLPARTHTHAYRCAVYSLEKEIRKAGSSAMAQPAAFLVDQKYRAEYLITQLFQWSSKVHRALQEAADFVPAS